MGTLSMHTSDVRRKSKKKIKKIKKILTPDGNDHVGRGVSVDQVKKYLLY
jgi:hypothetical protein